MIETLTVPPSTVPPSTGAPSYDDGDRPGFLDCRGVWHELSTTPVEASAC